MKIADWEKVVLVWVNALKLTDEEITDVSQLHESDFFLNLISCLGKPEDDEHAKDSGVVLKAVRSVLEEEFGGFTIADGHWDNYETTLVTSLLLLLSAFKCQHLRTPLYGLCGETQLVIQAFIQKFISIHKFTPLEQISRQLLITSLTDLSPGDEDCTSEIDVLEGEMTPPRRFFSPVKSISSPETQRIGQAKVKSLECQLELMSWDKQHLIDEIEALKADVSDLSTKYEGKAAQVLKLENELFMSGNSSFRLDNDRDSSNCDPSNEIELLKNDLETMTFRLSSCTSDMDREQLRNADLSAKLRRAEEENISLTEKCADYGVKVSALQANINDLEGVVASLKTTIKDQAELLSDSSFIASSPHPRDLSLNESAIMGETMANVVEIKYSELEDELEVVKEQLHQCEDQTQELQKQLEAKGRETEELLSKIREHEIEDFEKVSRLQSELTEKAADVEDLKEDNEFLTTSIVEKRKDMERLHTDFIRLKRREEQLAEELSALQSVPTCSCGGKSRSEEAPGEGRSVNEEFAQKLAHLSSLLEGKQVRLEEATSLVDRIKRELSEHENEKDALVTENRSIKTKLSSAQAKMSELIKDLAELVGGGSPSNSPYVLLSKVSSQISSLSSQVDQLTAANSKYEEEVAKLKREAKSSLRTTEKANDDVASLRDLSRALESELENLRGQHRVRGTELLAVQQAVSMCEHEKAILQRRIDLLSIDAEKCEGLRSEVSRLKSFVNNLEMELSTEKMEHKRLRDQMEMNEKLSVSFDTKLSALQTELKSQYDKAIDKCNEKINLMKQRIMKDKSHIKELSSDLWETSDRYLLASQEADALRNQLRRTRTALELVASAQAPQKENMTPRSNPNLWNSSEIEDDFDERVIVTRERWARRQSGGGSLWGDASGQWHIDPEEEVFGDAFLEDLKAGIVRLPSQQAALASRASCPPIKSNESSREGERFAHDKQSLIPPEKPKRKGHVAYCRPGPPTPSRNARLSLQSLDRVGHIRDPPLERRQSSSQPNRLSRLFSTISSKTKTAPLPADAPPQPQAKRKGFFRKFGSSRENIPPPWH